MKNGMLLCLWVLAAWATSCKDKVSPKGIGNKLLGSWAMEQVHWKSPDTTVSIEKAQPGILMFTQRNYSLVWTPTREKREAFEVLAKPSEPEILEAFRSIVFNSGTYTHTDSTVTTRAKVAKVPGFEGGRQYYRYTIQDTILNITMYDERYPDGSKPDWSGRWETRFILKKMD